MGPTEWITSGRSGRTVSLQLDRDGLVKRAFMLVIALYLIVALALPLWTMLSKSFVTYSFDLTRFEFQVSDETGSTFGPSLTGAALNARSNSRSVSANVVRRADLGP